MGLRSTFRALLLEDVNHDADQYALRGRKAVKPSPGQTSLWDESAHPRAPKGAHESHGGEFVKRGDSQGEQLGLFGGSMQPKREGPASVKLKPGEETRGKQDLLFPVSGNKDQGSLFGDDQIDVRGNAVEPEGKPHNWDSLPPEAHRGFESSVLKPLREHVGQLDELASNKMLGPRYAWEVATKNGAKPGDGHPGTAGMQRWIDHAKKAGIDNAEQLACDHPELKELAGKLDKHRAWGTTPTGVKPDPKPFQPKMLEPEAKPTEKQKTEQVVYKLKDFDHWANTHIKIAADDISRLRGIDIYRVMSQAPADKQTELDRWITRKRPDLAGAVNEAHTDILQERADAKDAAEAKLKPSGIQPVTRSNDEAKAGDQLGLFGEAARPKREAPPMLAPGGETKGKAQALFDTRGNADQMDLFGDGVMPDDLVAKESRAGFQPMLVGDGAEKKSDEPVASNLGPIPFRDRRSFADKMAADGKSHSDIVEAMQSRGVASVDARRHAANALGDLAQSQPATPAEPAKASDPVESLRKEPKIEPRKEPSPAKPRAPRKPQAAGPNKHGIEDFGEKIGGARKETASPIGPRAKKQIEESEAGKPGWLRRYKVAEDANKPGEYFIADTRTNTPHFDEDPSEVGSYTSILRKKGIGGGGKNFTSKEAAEKHIALIEAHRNHGVTNRGSADNPNYAIYRKVSDRKMPTVRDGFKTREEAVAHLKANPAAIVEHKFPNYETYQYLDSVTREGGKQHRQGDVNHKDFQTAFNFRGGEFGKWQMNKDGQTSLNHAYDALHDLADILELPTKAVSLNGDLAIGFGSRGTGGKDSARAHYEPAARVINLTKMKGAGTLAHEWLHALDHHLTKVVGASGSTTSTLNRHDLRDARPELAEAIKGVHDVIAAKHETTVVTAPKALPDKRAKEREETRARAREHGTEIPFADSPEDHVYNIRKALDRWAEYKKKKMDPKVLKEYDALGSKIAAGDYGKPMHVNNGRSPFGGYSTFENVEKLNELHKKLCGRGFHTKEEHSSGNKLYWQIKRDNMAAERVKAAEEGQTETRKVKTDFLRESMEMDKVRASDYYSEPEEMMARAFESYIHDKLESRGHKSQYLGAKAHNKHYVMFGMKPFPEGEERSAINAAFDHLFKTLKHETRSDDRGDHIKLYSASKDPARRLYRPMILEAENV